MFCRRSKYMDFFLCSSFLILFVYAYFSRQVLLEKLHREEDERLKLEHNANSLKEELKIVYYHTSKLEEALKAEQDSHKSTNSRLSSQSQDFRINMTKLQIQYAAKLKEKNNNIKTYMLENEELKEKHKLVAKHFNILAKEHKKVSVEIKADYDKLKKSKDEESIRLQDEIQETYNKKVYFQKKAALNEDDYKKTLKKLARCKSILSRRNITTHSQMQKILSSNNAQRKKSAKSSAKKNVKVIADTTPTQTNSKLEEAKTLSTKRTTKQLSDHTNVLPTENVHKQHLQNNLPVENVLNKHNSLKTSPTEKVSTHDASANKLLLKQHDMLENLPTEKVISKKVLHEKVIDHQLVEKSSPTENNIINRVIMEQVESPAKLPLVVTHKQPVPKTEKVTAGKPIETSEREVGGEKGKHVVVEERNSKITIPNLIVEDKT